MLKPGTVIANKYEIIREIGKGGMSTVYLSMDVSLNKQWALKAIDKTSQEFQSVDTPRVLMEVDMMKHLDHPSLPRIVDVLDTEETLYIIMDYIEGETLAKVLDMYGAVKQEEVIKWSLQLCDVLNYLHHQNPPIIYRDMKPANIMLRPEGDVKVIDFGIARKYKPGSTEDTVALGTKGYAAPEQFSGNGQTDQRTDIFNLGVTMYQLLTNRNPAKPPYKIEPITKIDSSLSNGLEKIINKATKEDPNQRYQTVEEFARAIANYRKLDEEEIKRHKKKVLKLYKLFVAGILFIVAGVGVIGFDYFQTNNQYENLVNNNSVSSKEKISNLKKAIKIKPDQPKAYAELIKEYAKDGFTEEEAAKFSQIYSSHQNEMKDKENYANLNYIIGRNIILYYNGETDNSNRNKLITAEPFFSDSINNGLSGDAKIIASAYKFMADYYNKYVIAANSLEVKEPTLDEYSKFLKQSNDLIDNLEKYEGDNKTHLFLVSCSIVQSFIGSEKDNMIKKGVNKDNISNLENKLYEKSSQASTSSESSQKIKKQIMENHKYFQLQNEK